MPKVILQTLDYWLSMFRTAPALTVTEEMVLCMTFRVSLSCLQDNAKVKVPYISNFSLFLQVEDVLHFLDIGDYTFQDLLRIQKQLNYVLGPHKECMHLVANRVHVSVLNS